MDGLLSFFSPCVLPLLPLYIGYLSGGTAQVGEDGNIYYRQKKVWINTLFFVLGISFTFFLLGLGVSAMGSFFRDNRLLFTRIGAIIIIFFGLYQLGLFGKSNVLNKEHRFLLPLEKMKMSPVTAFVMGFAFSFAWTPCIGPVLTSVLLMTATARTQLAGMTLIGVYTLGFVLPFLAVGAFTTGLLALFKKHRGVVKYTVKIGAILMILMGLLMFTGKMNEVSGYLSEASAAEDSEENDVGAEETAVTAIDFELTDQYGETHTLADYEGKTIFLNFWATWCPPCRAEMPDIQKLYEAYAVYWQKNFLNLTMMRRPEALRQRYVLTMRRFPVPTVIMQPRRTTGYRFPYPIRQSALLPGQSFKTRHLPISMPTREAGNVHRRQ